MTRDPSSNRFLAVLSGPVRDQIIAASQFHELPVGTVLYRQDEDVRFCHLLTSGMASIVLSTLEGGSAEVGMVGREGLVGCTQLLGPAMVPTTAVIQLAASGFRIRREALAELFDQHAEVRTRILEFVQQQLFTLFQIAGCNRLHQAEGRLARWLLMAQDRTGSAELKCTQDFLGQMLGLERPTVSLIAANLKKQGLIGYSRGHLTIASREGMEQVACSCYPMAKMLYEELYTRPVKAVV